MVYFAEKDLEHVPIYEADEWVDKLLLAGYTFPLLEDPLKDEVLENLAYDLGPGQFLWDALYAEAPGAVHIVNLPPHMVFAVERRVKVQCVQLDGEITTQFGEKVKPYPVHRGE